MACLRKRGTKYYAQHSDGSGTAADLIALGEMPDDCDKHFMLTAEIDLDPNLAGREVLDRAVIAPETRALLRGPSGWRA
jgi:hypothetical protein